jgi:hypothetical protein
VPTVALLNAHQTLGDFLESLIFARRSATACSRWGEGMEMAA